MLENPAFSRQRPPFQGFRLGQKMYCYPPTIARRMPELRPNAILVVSAVYHLPVFLLIFLEEKL
jgi:hypothetical protein